MNPPRSTFSDRGAALLLVLWSIVILSSAVIVIARLVDFDINTETRLGKRFAARQMALTGLAFAMHPDIKRGDPILFQQPDKLQKFEVEIQSEDARININKMITDTQSSSLEKLFRFWGIQDNPSRITLDSLKDWVDKDEFRSLNGAEISDINPESGYSQPENRPFLSLGEVETVRGMDSVLAVHPNWKDSFSIYSSNKLDLQSVNEDLLQVFGGLSRSQASAFVTYRNGPDRRPATQDDVEIKTIESVEGVIGLSEIQMEMLQENFSTGSSLVHIVSRGYCGDVQYTISVVLNKSDRSTEGILEWVER